MATNKNQKDIIITSGLLRGGLAVVFMYAALNSLMHPQEWAGFLPTFTHSLLNSITLIKLVALYELGLVIWLISGWKIRYAGLICAITLAGIVIATPSQLIVTFRDAGLACMGLALFFLE